MSEAGLPGFNIVAWVAFVAPAGTPKDITLKLHEAVSRTLKEESFRKRLVDMGIDPIGMPPDEFAEFLRKETPALEGDRGRGRRPAALTALYRLCRRVERGGDAFRRRLIERPLPQTQAHRELEIFHGAHHRRRHAAAAGGAF